MSENIIQNGKGSKPRPLNIKKYQSNFEEIEWREVGTYCEECGLSLKYPKNRNKHFFNNIWKCHEGECNFN